MANYYPNWYNPGLANGVMPANPKAVGIKTTVEPAPPNSIDYSDVDMSGIINMAKAMEAAKLAEQERIQKQFYIPANGQTSEFGNFGTSSVPVPTPTNSVGFTGDYANAPIAARGATGSGGSVSVAPQTAQKPTATPQKTPSASGKQSSGTGNAIKANPGNGRGSYDPTPHYFGMSKGQLEGETPIAAAPEIFTGLPSAMQGNEYAQAAANGDMANAVAAQALAEAPASVAQAAQQSRYDQLMQDYALSQMADEEAIRRYMAQNPAQYGEDIGSLYDMLYGRN